MTSLSLNARRSGEMRTCRRRNRKSATACSSNKFKVWKHWKNKNRKRMERVDLFCIIIFIYWLYKTDNVVFNCKSKLRGLKISICCPELGTISARQTGQRYELKNPDDYNVAFVVWLWKDIYFFVFDCKSLLRLLVSVDRFLVRRLHYFFSARKTYKTQSIK